MSDDINVNISAEKEQPDPNWKDYVAEHLRMIHAKLGVGDDRMDRIEGSQRKYDARMDGIEDKLDANTTVCNSIEKNTSDLVEFQKNVTVGRSILRSLGRLLMWVAGLIAAWEVIWGDALSKILRH